MRRSGVLTLVATVALSWLAAASPSHASASDEAAETATPDVAAVAPARDVRAELLDSSTTDSLVRIVLAVGVVVLGCLGMVLWGSKRRQALAGGDLRIDLLAIKSLGPRHRVAVVQTGDRRLLVGMGNETIQTLADLSEAIEFAPELERRLAAEEKEAPPQLLNRIGSFEGLDG